MAKGDSQVTQQIDPWTKDKMDQLWARGTDMVTNTPYATYGGSTVAGMQPMQLAAQDFLSQQLLGQSFPYQSPQTGGPYQPGFNPFGTPFDQAQPRNGIPYRPEDGGASVGPGGYSQGGNYEDEYSGVPGNYRPMFGMVPDIAEDGMPVMGDPTRPSSGMPGGGMATGVGGGTGIMEAQQAANVARGIAGGAQNPMVQGGNLLGGIGMYQNPYENQVVNQAMSDIDRSRQLAQVGNASDATLSGAFGGDRHAIVEAETNRAAMDQMARTSAQLRSQGFNTAADLAQSDASRGLTAGMANQNAFFQGRGQQLQGAGLLSSLGGDIFGRTLGTADALAGMGGQQQNQAQAELGDDVSRFYEARDYPMQQFAFLQSLLGGFPAGLTQTMSGGRNRGAGFLGGAASGAGIGSTFGPIGAGVGGVAGGLLGLL